MQLKTKEQRQADVQAIKLSIQDMPNKPAREARQVTLAVEEYDDLAPIGELFKGATIQLILADGTQVKLADVPDVSKWTAGTSKKGNAFITVYDDGVYPSSLGKMIGRYELSKRNTINLRPPKE